MPAATELAIFVEFLLLLGKEYYKDSTCLGPPNQHGGQTFPYVHPKTNCCSSSGGDWKQTLVAGTAQPAIGVLQIERMTEEHAHALLSDMLVPHGVWQGSENGGKEKRNAGVLCTARNTVY